MTNGSRMFAWRPVSYVANGTRRDTSTAIRQHPAASIAGASESARRLAELLGADRIAAADILTQLRDSGVDVPAARDRGGWSDNASDLVDELNEIFKGNLRTPGFEIPDWRTFGTGNPGTFNVGGLTGQDGVRRPGGRIDYHDRPDTPWQHVESHDDDDEADEDSSTTTSSGSDTDADAGPRRATDEEIEADLDFEDRVAAALGLLAPDDAGTPSSGSNPDAGDAGGDEDEDEDEDTHGDTDLDDGDDRLQPARTGGAPTISGDRRPPRVGPSLGGGVLNPPVSPLEPASPDAGPSGALALVWGLLPAYLRRQAAPAPRPTSIGPGGYQGPESWAPRAAGRLRRIRTSYDPDPNGTVSSVADGVRALLRGRNGGRTPGQRPPSPAALAAAVRVLTTAVGIGGTTKKPR